MKAFIFLIIISSFYVLSQDTPRQALIKVLQARIKTVTYTNTSFPRIDVICTRVSSSYISVMCLSATSQWCQSGCTKAFGKSIATCYLSENCYMTVPVISGTFVYSSTAVAQGSFDVSTLLTGYPEAFVTSVQAFYANAAPDFNSIILVVNGASGVKDVYLAGGRYYNGNAEIGYMSVNISSTVKTWTHPLPSILAYVEFRLRYNALKYMKLNVV